MASVTNEALIPCLPAAISKTEPLPTKELAEAAKRKADVILYGGMITGGTLSGMAVFLTNWLPSQCLLPMFIIFLLSFAQSVLDAIRGGDITRTIAKHERKVLASGEFERTIEIWDHGQTAVLIAGYKAIVVHGELPQLTPGTDIEIVENGLGERWIEIK